MTSQRTKLPTLRAEQTDANPYLDASGTMDHWRCVLRFQGRTMSVVFSMGHGHHGKCPTVRDVLSCLVSDAQGIAGQGSFEDWCAEYGYDTDSRRAERTWRACVRQSRSLRRLLGADFDSIALAVQDC